ncbi:OTU domain-containing protein 7B-like isoform X1 [Pomacea canaliculata]|uniref:OTU domain-containing protein 7B-like isoform X1 n=1 Tax=Pomacea canaliculata TaxID=400727 RepID=UPI000D733DA2|nr:OTU domain-containing protein 7B-like isoform X1 [Pomacea canaliculata]XP_025077086.1 OTU domain-containing protein 7B-like isoform X1 [Pomacea canaliculata]
MATTKEQEKLVLEFCENTGADKEWAYSVLARNKWNMPSSYREIEQMLINSSRGQQTREITQCASHHKSESPTLISQIYFQPSSGEMPKSIGPAVEFDPQEVRAPVSTACRSSTGNFLQGIEGLRVALPPAHTPVERVIPIRMEGRTVSYPQSVSQTSSRSQHHHAATSVHHPIYDEKVIAIQPSKEKTEIINPAIGSENIQTLSSNVKSGSSSESYPKLKRGFSNILENEFLVSDARSSVLHDIQENSHDHMYIQSFVLPNITDFPEDFQAFLEKELIETSTLISLEQAGRLNWWAEIGLCQRLIPLATSGDGNCLLHAASLAMWGIHDRQLILRNALHSMLTKEPLCQNLYRRWRWQQDIVNRQSGLVLSELEWKAEWDNILRLASPSPRGLPNNSRNSVSSCCDSPLTRNIVESEPVVYESLEEFHVFVLAHVLQRPIIVVADTVLKDSSGEDLAPIPFGGIYLPVECNSASCYSSPLLLTYDAAHFSALVPVARSTYDTMHICHWLFLLWTQV